MNIDFVNIDLYIKNGKQICDENNFFSTLRLLIKYFFLYNKSDINIMDLIRNVSGSENDFKIFMVYKNFSLDLYYKYKNIINEKLNKLNDEDASHYEKITFILIYLVKKEYDNDHSVLSKYITTINDDKETIEKFNFIKNTYSLNEETTKKINEISEAINYLEQSIILEEKSKDLRNKALKILYKVHNGFQNKIKSSNELKLLTNF